jgi:replicative DNA helicase
LLEAAPVEPEVEKLIKQLLQLSAQSQRLKSYASLNEAIEMAIEEAQGELSGQAVRLSTGFSDLDRIIFGLEKCRLYVIAAEEKIGKSLVAHQSALSSARIGHPAAIISLEMRSVEIAKRFSGGIAGNQVSQRLAALKKFQEEARDLPLYIRDGSADSAKVLTLARILYAERKIELLVVDYLQLIELEGRSRVDEINEFVARLKGLSMDLEIPIILVAGVLNKQINARGKSDRKPCPADIRDTGRLANDADCLIFLWKPFPDNESYIELFVARSRYSKLGRMGLHLDSDTLKLSQTTLREPPGKHNAADWF